jgi:two-component system, chemotaxis family, protein-glutamate methylesterase/glutaminase
VASAGGIDAVSHVLSGLPDGFDASVLVLIHQEPDRHSQLVELLGRCCVLPVVEAQHDVALAPGEVAVVPPGKHLLVTPGVRTALIASGAAPPSRPSADLLLATLATAAGSRAIAVVLSGGGHDGATGATAVHVCGGTVVATDEASSESYSMPLAAIEREDAVDHIVSLDQVPGTLTALVGAARDTMP